MLLYEGERLKQIMKEFSALYGMPDDIYSKQNDCYDIVIDGMEVTFSLHFGVVYLVSPIVKLPDNDKDTLYLITKLLKHSLLKVLNSDFVLAWDKDNRIVLQGMLLESSVDLMLLQDCVKKFVDELQECLNILAHKKEKPFAYAGQMIFTP